MNTKKHFTLVIVLIFINLLMLLKVLILRKAIKESTMLLEIQNIKSQESNFLLNYYFNSITQSNRLLNKPISDIYRDISITDSVCLCLRISTKHCRTCIKTQIELLRLFQEKYGVKNIYIIIEALTERELGFFIEEYDIQFEIIQSKEIINEIENHNNPYYFLVINGKIHYPFMPIKEYTEITKAYFEKVSQILNSELF